MVIQMVGGNQRKRDNMQQINTIDQLIKTAGGRALLVGGAVRDKLMGWEPKDFDI